MTNKDRKKKVIKWLLIGIGCIVLFGVLNGIDSIIVSYNQSAIMEYRVSGGAVSPNTISRGAAYYIIMSIGFLISGLGFIISTILFIINLISCWINNTPEVVQQVVETNSDPLVQLSNLYNQRLLTREEFEEKKRQLKRGSK